MSVLNKVTSNVTAQRLTQEQVYKVLGEVGLGAGQIGLLATRTDLLGPVDAKLNQLLGLA